MANDFESANCKGTVATTITNNYDIVINGVITKDYTTDPSVRYAAPAPPDTVTSFSGSGLPYASRSQAYDNSPNIGSARVDANGRFTITLKRPNSYYADFNTLVTPYVTMKYNHGKDVLKVALDYEKISYRSLQYPSLRKQKKEMFYSKKLPVRSQERILRDSAYCDFKQEAPDFWGLKPPL